MAVTSFEDIEKELTVRRQLLDGRLEEKTIHPVADEDLASYKMLGCGDAQSVGMALHLAFQHCSNFFERVAGYRVGRSHEAEVIENALIEELGELPHGAPYRSIEFYEKA